MIGRSHDRPDCPADGALSSDGRPECAGRHRRRGVTGVSFVVSVDDAMSPGGIAMSDLAIAGLLIAFLIALAIAAPIWGYDSRDGAVEAR